jgi:hypothetical protein
VSKSNYATSITSKYGDVERVRADVLVLSEIQSRQGTSLLIDVIAESCGHNANKFNLNAEERKRLLETLVAELREAILERT